MAFIVTVRGELGVVELRFEGAVDVAQLGDTRLEVRRLLEEDPTRNVLVDMRKMDFSMSTFDIYSFASTIQLPTSSRIALLAKPDDKNAEFFETVAKNRGIPLRLFTELDEAMSFLKK